MKKLLFLIVLFPLVPLAQQQPKQNIWHPFEYFTGCWTGNETGKAGIGKGERTYEFIMNGKYLFQKNTSKFEPQKKILTAKPTRIGHFSVMTNKEKRLCCGNFTSKDL